MRNGKWKIMENDFFYIGGKPMTRSNPLRFTLRASLLFALFLFPFTFVAAQSATATLSGAVVDQNGAVVPSADITIINTATGLQRQTTTNDAGEFPVPLLPPTPSPVT